MKKDLVLGLEIESAKTVRGIKKFDTYWYITDEKGKKTDLGRLSNRKVQEVISCIVAFAKGTRRIKGMTFGGSYISIDEMKYFLSSRDNGPIVRLDKNMAPEPNKEPALDRFFSRLG